MSAETRQRLAEAKKAWRAKKKVRTPEGAKAERPKVQNGISGSGSSPTASLKGLCAAQSPNRTVARLHVQAYVVQIINVAPVERPGVTTPGSHEAQLIIDLPTSNPTPIEILSPSTESPLAASADLRGSLPNTSGVLPQTEFSDGALLRTYTYVVK